MSLRGTLRVLWIWGPLVVYATLIFYLSILSDVSWAARYPDYLEHAVEFMGLAILMARALNNGLLRSVPGRTLLIAFAICVSYGSLDELYQYLFVPNRFGDVVDVLSDAVGAGIGLAALGASGRFLVRRSEP